MRVRLTNPRILGHNDRRHKGGPMSASVVRRGNKVGSVLTVSAVLTGNDVSPGGKWNLDIPGVPLTAGEQEVPAGTTGDYTMTWTSSGPLPEGLPSPLEATLIDATAVPPVNNIVVQIDILPATVVASTTTPPAITPSTPANPAQVVSAPVSNWLILGMFLVGILGFLAFVLLPVFLFNSFAGQLEQAPSVDADSKDSVTTHISRTVVSDDPTVLKAAAESDASISSTH